MQYVKGKKGNRRKDRLLLLPDNQREIKYQLLKGNWNDLCILLSQGSVILIGITTETAGHVNAPANVIFLTLTGCFGISINRNSKQTRDCYLYNVANFKTIIIYQTIFMNSGRGNSIQFKSIIFFTHLRKFNNKLK